MFEIEIEFLGDAPRLPCPAWGVVIGLGGTVSIACVPDHARNDISPTAEAVQHIRGPPRRTATGFAIRGQKRADGGPVMNAGQRSTLQQAKQKLNEAISLIEQVDDEASAEALEQAVNLVGEALDQLEEAQQ